MPSAKPNSKPTLSRRPLTTSNADQALFVYRTAETKTIMASLDMGLNTWLVGPAGAGKTTLLRHVLRQLENAGDNAVYVNVESARSAAEVIALIAASIHPDTTTSSSAVSDETDLAKLEAAATEPVVVLIDGIDEQSTATLFGRYRDRLWESPQLTWVVASRHAAPPAPADAFFDRIVSLGAFTHAETVKFLELRTPWIDDSARRRLAEGLGAAQPITLMLMAQQLAVTDTDVDTLLDALAEQRRQTAELPDRLRNLYNALVEVGPVHAGDQELHQRIGASRPWIATGLKELEELGLAQTEKDGRRKLYEAFNNVFRFAVEAAI